MNDTNINTDTTPLIEVDKLYKSFGKHEVLKGISTTINKGDVVAIIGPSGCGKSTFLRSLNLLEDTTDGHILFEGTDITDDSVDINTIREKIGMVFQQFNLFENMTVLENIMLAPVKRNKMTKDEAAAKARELLGRIGLEDKENAYPSTLSGGQKQRIAIARAMINDPSIILADEPTGALDSQTGHMIMDIFHKLHEEQGKTVVLITHSKELAAETERIVTLNDGMIVSDSKKTEKGCDLSGHHKMNDGCNKPEIGEEGMIC